MCTKFTIKIMNYSLSNNNIVILKVLVYHGCLLVIGNAQSSLTAKTRNLFNNRLSWAHLGPIVSRGVGLWARGSGRNGGAFRKTSVYHEIVEVP